MTGSELSPAEAAEIFGGEVGTIDPNPDELAVDLVLREIRDLIMCAAQEGGVGVNQLAKRLDIAPSSVSRFLGGEGDMRVSTAVLYARALGRVWDFSLRHNEDAVTKGNHIGCPVVMISAAPGAATSGSIMQFSTVEPQVKMRVI